VYLLHSLQFLAVRDIGVTNVVCIYSIRSSFWLFVTLVLRMLCVSAPFAPILAVRDIGVTNVVCICSIRSSFWLFVTTVLLLLS
jgi:hypothetical protein